MMKDMTGKELLLAAMRNEETPRPAWLPFVGVHGGKLIGKTATDYLQSPDAIVEGLTKARELYRPDGLPILFDLQMEAEVLGCQVQWSDEVPPSVISHPLTSCTLDDLPEFHAGKGRYPIAKEALLRCKETMGGEVALYGLITGPFTLASHLRGSELFLDMLTRPAEVHALVNYCAEVGCRAADFYLQNGADVIAVVDPMTSQISQAHFEDFIAQPLNRVFAHVAANNGLSSLFVCGDATRNLELMCRTKCDNLQVDENIPLDLLKNLAGKYNKSFGGNLKLTVVLLLGSTADCMLDAIRCIDLAGLRGFILAPGCDLPYATPEQNLIAVSQMVHDDYQRQVSRTSLKATQMESFEDLQLPDYSNKDVVFVDVITLDSSACAPCLYMVDAARNAAGQANCYTTVREHKVKTRNGIGYMCRLHVENIPSICIDGVVRFSSQIPDRETLIAAIEARAREKQGGTAP
ncbi:MAG TPA: uroporphyrinogen decarboxylase family protein [Candidatus Hydrogenedentes bacterium]|jgi:uroporphyrinogen decarboxylase|nr:uroporphyrinogen decarboxylase family protein [Candidatus Hydrogenedentota bacterium]